MVAFLFKFENLDLVGTELGIDLSTTLYSDVLVKNYPIFQDYLTVGQGMGSIEESREDLTAVEIATDEVEVQAAEQYSNVTSKPPTSPSSSSCQDDNPKSPLLANNHQSLTIDAPPPILRADTLEFPPSSRSSPRVRPESNYSQSNMHPAETVL